MKYDDLHRILYRLATSAGTNVTYNAPVITVSVRESQTALAVLADGEVIKADVIVGTDGYRSVVRDVVSDRDNNGTPTGMSVLR
jgi:salicylate hydroxylase